MPPPSGRYGAKCSTRSAGSGPMAAIIDPIRHTAAADEPGLHHAVGRRAARIPAALSIPKDPSAGDRPASGGRPDAGRVSLLPSQVRAHVGPLQLGELPADNAWAAHRDRL